MCFATSHQANHVTCRYISGSGMASELIQRPYHKYIFLLTRWTKYHIHSKKLNRANQLLHSWSIHWRECINWSSILEYMYCLHVSWTFLVLQQQQNLGRRFGTSKMHLSPPPPPPPVLRRWFCCCWLFVYCYSHCGSLQLLCFVLRYFMSTQVLRSSWLGRESWLLCLICLPGV